MLSPLEVLSTVDALRGAATVCLTRASATRHQERARSYLQEAEGLLSIASKLETEASSSSLIFHAGGCDAEMFGSLADPRRAP